MLGDMNVLLRGLAMWLAVIALCAAEWAVYFDNLYGFMDKPRTVTAVIPVAGVSDPGLDDRARISVLPHRL